MNKGRLPKRQRLIGLWLLLSGISIMGGAIFAAWLDSLFQPQGFPAWCCGWAAFPAAARSSSAACYSSACCSPRCVTCRSIGPAGGQSRRPRRLSPEGRLRGLGPDLVRVREAWRSDRRRLATAHAEGARSAARIRQELETLLQVLDTPLLLCDHHRRLLLFNQAAESLFEENPGLGLGKRLDTLLPVTSLQDAIGQLLEDGSPRELLIPCDERWLHAVLRRVPLSNGETLLTLTDATAAWNSEMGARAELAERLPPLRRHGASLSSAAEALGSARHAGRGDDALRARLETVIEEESRALGQALEGLGRLIEDMQQQGERLVPLWSNDLWQSLNERLGDDPLQVVPIGMPAWFKGDAPALLALLESLLAQLRQHTGHTTFEGEMLLGNRRVYLDLVWRGTPLAQRELAAWSERRLDSLPLSPRVGDLLRQHASDTWSLADADGIHARLRLPLPSVERVGAPREALPPRPEFHDFGIADLPPPDAELARCRCAPWKWWPSIPRPRGWSCAAAIP